MNELPITIKLLDGSLVEVEVCEFDLLIRLLYKHEFNRRKIVEEIESICVQNENPLVLKRLLKLTLCEFSSELANKILAKSFTENLPHKKIIEDMMIDVNRVKYCIAENANDVRKILRLRKRIFVEEEDYPSRNTINSFERESLHIMAIIRKELVGAVSIAFDGPRGIPLEQYVDLSKYKDKKVVEVDKLAVIGERRKRELSFQLMWLSYSVARYWGAERLFIFTLSRKTENLNMYTRFGFKKVAAFNIFRAEEATVLMLDFADVDTYEKRLETTELLKLGKKLLDNFSLAKA